MSIVRLGLRNPAALLVAVLVVAVAGIWSVLTLPVQLFPDIEQPQIGIEASWRAASPQEVERELLEPMEDVLDGLPGVDEMAGFANPGSAFVSLTFNIGTDMQETLLEVISRLNRMPTLPADADPPRIIMGGGQGGGNANDTLIYYFVQKLPGTPGELADSYQWLQDEVIPRIEAIDGVADVDFGGGFGAPEEEVQVVFDPIRAAQYGITIPHISQLVGRAQDVTGGFVDDGRRIYTVRFKGRFQPDQLSDLVLEWREGRPVRLGDVAEVKVALGRQWTYSFQNGNEAIGLRIMRESGANVLATLTEVKALMESLRDGPMAERGLTNNQSFDPSVYINNAIGLLTGNLLAGIVLAVGVLWLFLRRTQLTLLIGMVIPITLLALFFLLSLTGRSINVISLAGLAFGVGMVIDSAIVVLEAIVKRRDRGEGADEASLSGASRVTAALVASTATTVITFVPIVFMREVEGQIFADLALTIAVGVSVSLLICLTVLPVATARWMKVTPRMDAEDARWVEWLTRRIMGLTADAKRRVAVIGLLIAASLGGSWLLFPSLSYLPPVKRDSVDAFLNFPVGTSVDLSRDEVAKVIVDRMMPYYTGEKQPKAKNFYMLGWPGGGSFAVRLEDESRLDEMMEIVRNEILAGFPDVGAFPNRGNLFGGLGAEGNVSVHLQAGDPEALAEAAEKGQQLLRDMFPGVNVFANPNPEMSQPQLDILPNDRRIQEAGWTRPQVGQVVRALGDGLWLGEHFDGAKRLDIILRAPSWTGPEELEAIPVATPEGGIVPLGELVDVTRTVGPSNIQRIDGRRTITLNLDPQEGIALEEVLTKLREEAEPQLRGFLPADGVISYGGSADRLDETVAAMGQNFLIALALLFLLMALVFRSAKDSMLVMISIPLATVGGLALLDIVNLVTFQPLDLLTMIGFIILLGIVVNNAILLVDETRACQRDGFSRKDAVEQALRARIRPIFMSTLTTIAGMLPLLVMPGEGSVIYRGIAAVIVGGLSVSTIFTLVLLPALLRLGESLPGAQARPVDDGAGLLAAE
ncbi:efflux RND transporter permease subunit [Indioceanicola profundi]|uniref:efflux RND transporter permease subunit n=1 Tax=Indioceanicola profundi TaxID=2220096 RepID=UPI000E6AE0B4|nr:efflux RND transporter permease subunit [Indioceanicola profundi]